MTTQIGRISERNDKCQETNVRSIFYKKPIKKNNYKLEADYDDSPQEIRRQKLLQHQKESRDAFVNAARKLLDEALLSPDESDESMEIDVKRQYSRRYRHYANKLMMSEWMLDVPEDFLEKWSMVACPQGKRNLIVACKGSTKAFNRRGERLAEFNSALPGGNSNEHNRNCTILDCIWVAKHQTYYVLDVLTWSTQPLLNCDAEFRRFWLDSKLKEITELKMRDQNKNNYPFLSLPNIRCDENLTDFLLDLPSTPPLDGLLFYHREGIYMHGTTPLVTWLKPFMLSEVLGLSLPSTLDDKPDGYVDYRHHILARKKNKKTMSNSMEITESEVKDE
ncbi:snurportin-1 [Chelonus insularis]|uniref:snurportin-1 n=1 Tax=Chelonus insularis TaxID=460826 RepID=UPI00158D689F|nr:snurportin-1 [Chelonus insularis]